MVYNQQVFNTTHKGMRFVLLSVSARVQSPQEVLSHPQGTQALPRSQRGLHRTGRHPGHAPGPDREQRAEGLCEEERSGLQGLLDRSSGHCERGPVCWCQQHTHQLLELGPLQEAADGQQEGELCCSVSGRTGEMVWWGLPQPEKIYLRISYSIKGVYIALVVDPTFVIYAGH